MKKIRKTWAKQVLQPSVLRDKKRFSETQKKFSYTQKREVFASSQSHCKLKKCIIISALFFWKEVVLDQRGCSFLVIRENIWMQRTTYMYSYSDFGSCLTYASHISFGSLKQWSCKKWKELYSASPHISQIFHTSDIFSRLELPRLLL